MVDELLEAAKAEDPLPAMHSHGWLDNSGKNLWDKWTVIVQDKSKAVWEATLQVTNATTGEKILYDIHPIKNVEGSGSSDTPSTTTSKPQVGSEVNSRNQVFDETEVYNGRAVVSEETLDKWLKDYAASNPNYAQAYIAYMSPPDYLRMTTNCTVRVTKLPRGSYGLPRQCAHCLAMTCGRIGAISRAAEEPVAGPLRMQGGPRAFTSEIRRKPGQMGDR